VHGIGSSHKLSQAEKDKPAVDWAEVDVRRAFTEKSRKCFWWHAPKGVVSFIEQCVRTTSDSSHYGVAGKGLQQPQSEESNFEPQRHSWFTTRLRRLCGYAGVVVGEASNPGPAWCMYGERCPWHREKRCRFLHNGALDFWIVPQGDTVASLAQEVACLRLTLSAVQKELCATRQELADMRSTTAGTAVEPVTRPKSRKAGKRQRQKERKAAESGSFEEALEEHMGLLEESGPTGQTQSPALSLERIRSRPEGTWSPRPPSPRPEGTLSPRMQGTPKSPRGYPEDTARPPGLTGSAKAHQSHQEEVASPRTSQSSWMQSHKNSPAVSEAEPGEAGTDPEAAMRPHFDTQ